MGIGLTMIVAGVLPMPIVYLLRRFQILKADLDIHQGSIRRNETTASTKQMMDDDDVSTSKCRAWRLFFEPLRRSVFVQHVQHVTQFCVCV